MESNKNLHVHIKILAVEKRKLQRFRKVHDRDHNFIPFKLKNTSLKPLFSIRNKLL